MSFPITFFGVAIPRSTCVLHPADGAVHRPRERRATDPSSVRTRSAAVGRARTSGRARE